MSYYNSFNTNPQFVVITPNSNFVTASPVPLRLVAQSSAPQNVSHSIASPSPSRVRFVSLRAPPPRFVSQPVAQLPSASPRFIAQSPLTQRLLAQSQASHRAVAQRAASPRFIAQSPLTQRLLAQSQASSAQPTSSSRSYRAPAPSLQSQSPPASLTAQSPLSVSLFEPSQSSPPSLTAQTPLSVSLFEPSQSSPPSLTAQTPLSVSLFEPSQSPPCLTPVPQLASPSALSPCSSASSTPPYLSPPASPSVPSSHHSNGSPNLSDRLTTTYRGKWQDKVVAIPFRSTRRSDSRIPIDAFNAKLEEFMCESIAIHACFLIAVFHEDGLQIQFKDSCMRGHKRFEKTPSMPMQ
ncbi:hypothetical protein ANCCAN_02202 [Ancylostoma caninum]|uniref:Uncharacterized protein n=1 Tax=Ancylostoma caninum TaxID=29170 RepID=A0A368H4L3_ANCCA|nr:hypothetical protein ANCCAN_30507 [Ancylostoma caninum]RCN51536.1 hypothetical protein ANCCAN_02202 [Ancylostoma caninum]